MDMDIMYGQTECMESMYGQGCNVWPNRECMERLWTWIYCVDKQRMYGQGCNVWPNRESMERLGTWIYCMDKQRTYGQGCNVWTNTEYMEEMYGQTHSV